jgi:hypothetical protein
MSEGCVVGGGFEEARNCGQAPSAPQLVRARPYFTGYLLKKRERFLGLCPSCCRPVWKRYVGVGVCESSRRSCDNKSSMDVLMVASLAKLTFRGRCGRGWKAVLCHLRQVLVPVCLRRGRRSQGRANPARMRHLQVSDANHLEHCPPRLSLSGSYLLQGCGGRGGALRLRGEHAEQGAGPRGVVVGGEAALARGARVGSTFRAVYAFHLSYCKLSATRRGLFFWFIRGLCGVEGHGSCGLCCVLAGGGSRGSSRRGWVTHARR